MSYQDHLKTCSYCNSNKESQKVTVRIKSASSYNKQKKLSQLGAIIKGNSYAGLSTSLQPKTKGASSEFAAAREPGPIEREVKLKALGKMVRG